VELASAYSHRSQLDMLAWRMPSALHWGEKALALAKQLGDQEIVAHALGNLGSARADLETWTRCPELEESVALAMAQGYHDQVMRAFCNLTSIYYWRRDYASSLQFIERSVAYAAAHELTSWSGYIRGWRSMIRLDQGEWSAAEDEAQEISSRQSISDVYRFPALITLARLRSRRGDPDDGTPLEAARGLSASLAEPQRLIYVAVADAERLWLTTHPTVGDIEVRAGSASSREAVIARLREVQILGEERSVRWVIELAVLWRHVLGERGFNTEALSGPYRDHCEGRWRDAATGWQALGHPYERALALSEGDDPARREALDLFDRLGAVPAATRLRREMRSGGSRAIPRGPIGETRSHPAGLTRRQAQVLELIREGLTNGEIADQLCISCKTAEHHVSAILARFDAPTRREAIAAARKRGLFDQER
jgi:DNA-binding CsgD family transcriptional regulator